MECLVGFVKFPATSSLVYHSSKPKRNFVGGFRAKLHNNQSDPLLKAATRAALLRFHESRRPEPLFIDPYAGCFVNSDVDLDLEDSRHYCVATKFIDDKLLNTLNSLDGLKQVVLLTDGMDTRPYRLKWPVSTIIFDVSSERVFKTSVETLEGVGAKIPRGCLFHHVSIETPNLEHSLRTKGFNGNQSSVWAIQGLPIMTLANLEEILSVISGLAAKGCLVFGELPAWLARTEISINVNAKDWLDKLFMSNGFRVGATSYDEVAKSIGNELLSEDYKNLLFVAEQLRLSNDQMETWRREFQRIEEEGDEEGFEEL